jgi:hypothetical protein
MGPFQDPLGESHEQPSRLPRRVVPTTPAIPDPSQPSQPTASQAHQKLQPAPRRHKTCRPLCREQKEWQRGPGFSPRRRFAGHQRPPQSVPRPSTSFLALRPPDSGPRYEMLWLTRIANHPFPPSGTRDNLESIPATATFSPPPKAPRNETPACGGTQGPSQMIYHTEQLLGKPTSSVAVAFPSPPLGHPPVT